MAAGDSGEQSKDAAQVARHVFVSYASKDDAVADAAVEALERGGIACWIAPRNVTPGTFYADEIVRAIDSARATVLILSKHATDSPHVLRELERTTSKRHPLICLRLDRGALPASFEYFLNTSQWLDATDGEFARSIQRLIDAVKLAIRPAEDVAVASPPVVTPARSPGSPHRRTLMLAALIGLMVAGFAADRLWIENRAADPVATPSSTLSVSTNGIPEKAVAVLPFVDMSEHQDQQYFSDGLSEELIDILAKNRDLRVPARTSSFYFKNKQSTLAEIAHALGVAYVLEGSVRKSGTTIRVTAQLIQVDTGYHIWSETYDRAAGDIFKIQDDVAMSVATALKGSLTGPRVQRAAPTENFQAYVLYLQARALYERGTHAANEKAIELLKQALSLDPNFAPAWARLALFRAYEYGWFAQGTFLQTHEQANHDADLAIRLDPELSDAHLAKAFVQYFVDWDSAGAYKEFQRAIDIDPANVDALRPAAYAAANLLRSEEALHWADSAVAENPLDSFSYATLKDVLASQGRMPEAEAAVRKAVAVAPELPVWHTELALVLVAEGRAAEALVEANLDPGSSSTKHANLALILDALGRHGDADRELALAEKTAERTTLVDIADTYAERNDPDRAFAFLDRAFEQRDRGLLYLQSDPWLHRIEHDRRFKMILHQMHLTD